MDLKKIEHVGVMVSDMNRSIDFYTRVLGLSLRERRPFRTLELAFLTIGEAEIELIAGEDHLQGDAQVNHIAFSVSSLEDAVAAVRQEEPDVPFTDAIELWPGARCLFFRGPDGERLEFVERH
ncbi:VOC family protein [Pelagibacterium montanilacus]|uniref:VOC family protein n=1 Tax=Pelagibacterium montanilacus TaxID=2185280 RepID=UPI000F8F2542|nr:VOC family protein [Pelagibacterium montanilacus]